MTAVKLFIKKCLKKMYHALPIAETHKVKLKRYYFKHFQYLTQDVSKEEWDSMKNAVAAQFEGGRAEDYIGELYTRAATVPATYVAESKEAVELTEQDIRLIAFYLPQFHPFPENDQWWGRGFTEWTNVSKAVPQFMGHHQPHLPGELGFYDLRLPEVQKRQIELAKQYGLHGFCFHYYWFSGKRLLERPVDQFLADKSMNMPFCLCWANENWTRRWDGMENDILMGQRYSPEEDLAFIRDLEPYLRDSRYIRIQGKPLVVVYRVGLLPEPKKTAERWRNYCINAGIGDLYLVAAQGLDFILPDECGFDAAVEFPPHTVSCPNITEKAPVWNPSFAGTVFDLPAFIHSKCYLKPTDYVLFKGVFPSWDNTARKPNQGTIFWGSSPALYKEWLSDVIGYTKNHHQKQEQLVFINAWNEWGEGAHLEPDRKYGYAFLQATAEAVNESRAWRKKKIVVVSHDAHFHGAQLLALSLMKQLKEQFHYEVFLILKSGGVLEAEFAKHGHVYVLERDYAIREKLDGLVTMLRQSGVGVAVCNTVVTGDVLRVLSEAGMRTVSLIHELPGIIKSYQQENNAAYIAKYADKVVFPSEYVKKHFLSVVPELAAEKTCIRPQGLCKRNRYKESKEIARRQLRQEMNLPSEAKILLGVGYADERKGIDLFVEVALQVATKDEAAHFIWIGRWEDSMREAVAKKLNKHPAARQIHFLDAREDISLFYAGADLYLMTSREDPFPCVVVDSMDVGVPVVGFADAGGFSDIVTEQTGKLVPYLDVGAMRDAIIELLAQEKVRQELGRAAQSVVDEKFQFTDYVYELLAMLGHSYRRVSAVLPNYNYGHYLKQRLRSILDQSYPVYEIIVLDDCSSDDSRQRFQEFCEQEPSVVPLVFRPNAHNSGSVFRQWAKGMAASRGEYVWIAEADDLCLPEFLEEAMQPIEQNDQVVLSYTQSQQMGSDGTILADDYLGYTDDIDQEKWKKSYVREGVEEIQDTLVVKNTIPNVSAAVMRRQDMNAVVEELARYKVAGDWCYYVWLLQKGKIAYSPKALNLHRRHEQSVTQAEDKERHLQEIVSMQERILQQFPVSEDAKAISARYRQEVTQYLLGT
ncbi:glycoside hydrolase family 99-like domain-containing protein [uncultured Anaeromusa sp.]|uniref:glycoside hydrolase family 99-like domain-containing protein n=1 Tax=uncultured Anaeromusa sp. TaxID=673273 RepID=UPI0029C8EB3D|nr:glycoside hydrolase family 99-like domain-containing protein [uncultured Anaeromusa sp.]